MHVYARLLDQSRKVGLFTIFDHPFFNYEPFLFLLSIFQVLAHFITIPTHICRNHPLEHTIFTTTTPRITIPTTTTQHEPTTTKPFSQLPPQELPYQLQQPNMDTLSPITFKLPPLE